MIQMFKDQWPELRPAVNGSFRSSGLDSCPVMAIPGFIGACFSHSPAKESDGVAEIRLTISLHKGLNNNNDIHSVEGERGIPGDGGKIHAWTSCTVRGGNTNTSFRRKWTRRRDNRGKRCSTSCRHPHPPFCPSVSPFLILIIGLTHTHTHPLFHPVIPNRDLFCDQAALFVLSDLSYSLLPGFCQLSYRAPSHLLAIILCFLSHTQIHATAASVLCAPCSILHAAADDTEDGREKSERNTASLGEWNEFTPFKEHPKKRQAACFVTEQSTKNQIAGGKRCFFVYPESEAEEKKEEERIKEAKRRKETAKRSFS